MSTVWSIVAEKESREGNCRNMLLFGAAIPDQSEAGPAQAGPSDVLMCHAQTIAELRTFHNNVPYVQLQARVARELPDRGTFASRCAHHTASAFEAHIRDASSMTQLGNYLNAVSLPLAHYRECMKEPHHHVVTADTTRQVLSTYMLVLQLLILTTIVRFVPRLRGELWRFLGQLRNGDAESDGAYCSRCHHQRGDADAEDDGSDDDDGSRGCCESCGDLAACNRPTASARSATTTARTMYQRKLYFRSSITEYQGQQKRVIPDSVKRDVELHLRMNNLVDLGAPTRREMYRNVTCDATYAALKDTDNPKFYRDIYMIHAHVTDQQCLPCIRHLEAALMADFETMSEKFNVMGIQMSGDDTALGRSNFLNSNYVLFLYTRLAARSGERVARSGERAARSGGNAARSDRRVGPFFAE